MSAWQEKGRWRQVATSYVQQEHLKPHGAVAARPEMPEFKAGRSFQSPRRFKDHRNEQRIAQH